MPFRGFDHIDVRVNSVQAVEPFYDMLMPELGLGVKRYAHVDSEGNWHKADDRSPYNAIEYYEPREGTSEPRFIGFIEDSMMKATGTRIAFRVEAADFEKLKDLLQSIGARRIEQSLDAEYDSYRALFFEDPAGTKLEIAVR